MSETQPAVELAIYLLGPFEARLEGQPLPRLHSRKGQWLLVLLALQRGRVVERDWLAATLWPESTEEQAAANLRRSLWYLRQAIGPAEWRLVAPTRQTLRLDLEGAFTDVIAFEEALARGDEASLEEAVALYRGPALPDCPDEWILVEREACEQAYLGALERLAAHAMARDEPAAAVRSLRRLIAADPLRDSGQRALMAALAAAGDVAAATQVYRDYRLLLHRELNAAPAPETTTLFEGLRRQVREQRAPGVPAFRRSGVQADDDTQDGVATALPPPERPNARTPERLEPPAPALPSGTVTFLFTDIEGSARLWEQDPEAMRAALSRHDALLKGAIQGSGGHIFKTMGDQFCAAFATAAEAVAAALSAQRALQTEAWGPLGALRVRMAIHTGAAAARVRDYLGPPLNRVARLLDAAHGEQILLSQASADLVPEELPADTSLCDLGMHRLRDLQRPEHIFGLRHPELHGEFPPLRSLDALPNNLPQQVTRFIGRGREIAEVKALLAARGVRVFMSSGVQATDAAEPPTHEPRRAPEHPNTRTPEHPNTRLVTVTGTGGTGKTRLALQVAADLLHDYADGVWLVELASLADPALVPQTVASALGIREEPGRPLLPSLVEALKPKKLLLLLDNCEHLLVACAQLAEALLQGCPAVQLLATSREAFNIGGETPYRLRSLSVPSDRPAANERQPSLEHWTESEAVQLFVDRATTVAPSFVLTAANAPAVAQICSRLDGIPPPLTLRAQHFRRNTQYSPSTRATCSTG